MNPPLDCAGEPAGVEAQQDDRLEVLIVEDSPDDALLAMDALQAGGFAPSFDRVETAAEMRQALSGRSWHLILADYRLPGFGAMEAFAIYREAGLDIPFIIVSGVIGEEVAVAAMKAGVHDYLIKGRLARLAPAVRRELRDARMRREHARVEAALHSTYSELAAIHASAPVALAVMDEEMRISRVNELAAQFAGHAAAETVGLRCGGGFGCANSVAAVQGSECGPACKECPLHQMVGDTLRTGMPHGKIEMPLSVFVNGKRETRWFLLSCSRMASATGNKALVCGQDISELKQAQIEVQRQRDAMALQAHLINLSHDAIIVADADRTIRGWNKGAEEVYGWTAAEATGAPTAGLLRTSSAVAAAEIDQRLLREGHWEGELSHVRRDGRPILTESRQVVFRDGGGSIVAILEINRDITERRRAEDSLQETVAALESALGEKTVLLKEIHHRVKNNLAVIASLLSLKSAATRSAQVRAALKSSEDRVHSMALIHEHLYGGGQLDRINFRDYTSELVHEQLSASEGSAGRISMQLALDPIELDIERAVPCALILNELLSNSLKHAFPEASRGTIRISFHQLGPETLELVFEDSGIGLAADRLADESAKSLGLRIVGILARQLSGTLEHENGSGSRFVLRFPARAAAEHRHASAG